MSQTAVCGSDPCVFISYRGCVGIPRAEFHCMRLLLLVSVTGCLCFAQTVSIGAVGGIRLTDDIRSGQANQSIPDRFSVASGTTSESKRYVVGPAIELELPFSLALEFDALYRREGYHSRIDVSISPLPSNLIGPFGGTQIERGRANSWEFPIILKYKMRLPVIKPYVEVGYAHRVMNGLINDDLSIASLLPPAPRHDFPPSVVDTNFSSSHGAVAGLGVQLAFGRLIVSPEVRYTRWNNAAIRDAAFSALFQYGPGFESARNQVDLQIVFRWKVH